MSNSEGSEGATYRRGGADLLSAKSRKRRVAFHIPNSYPRRTIKSAHLGSNWATAMVSPSTGAESQISDHGQARTPSNTPSSSTRNRSETATKLANTPDVSSPTSTDTLPSPSTDLNGRQRGGLWSQSFWTMTFWSR